jgi:hypothetical protein
MSESKRSTLDADALYLDAHGGIWRAASDATEVTHVKRWDEMAVLDPTVNPWVEPAEKAAAEFGPLLFLSDALAPAEEAVFLFAITGKDAYEADVVHRALGLLDAFRAEVAR